MLSVFIWRCYSPIEPSLCMLVSRRCTEFSSNWMIPLSYPQLLLRSTTMTLMLSALLRPRARRVRSAAANMLRDGYNAPAPSSSIWGLALAGGFFSRRHSRATWQAKSLDKTSHKPSLARIKHSSSGSLFVKVISGSAITTGFKYLSPAQKNITEEKELSKHFKNPCIQRWIIDHPVLDTNIIPSQPKQKLWANW
jgi:hypothetical protein